MAETRILPYVTLHTMKKRYLFCLAFLTACATGKTVSTTENPTAAVEPHVAAIRQQYAPDKRTVLFKVEPRGGWLTGETTSPEAKAALLEKLRSSGISLQDSLQVLPEASLAGKTQAVVKLSVANLRSEPKHPAELATQATLGTPLRVWKQQRGWYLVQTPDQYLAWVDGSGIQLMDAAQYARWQQNPKLLYTQPYGFAFAQPNTQGATVSDLVYGDVLELQEQKQGFYAVKFPDGRTGYVPAEAAMRYEDWMSSRQPTEENLVQSAKKLLGLPYLWGGTSFKGVDCSGFTKTVYFMNGLVLPRDASQQVNIGELVDTQNGWQNMRPGDLLFFGTPAQDGKPERVVHVGMWIGNNEFIHSAGSVRISSMDPAAPNYDESEHRRFLRAKHIPPQATVLDLRKTKLYQ